MSAFMGPEPPPKYSAVRDPATVAECDEVLLFLALIESRDEVRVAIDSLLDLRFLLLLEESYLPEAQL